jgi:hypothetical protein
MAEISRWSAKRSLAPSRRRDWSVVGVHWRDDGLSSHPGRTIRRAATVGSIEPCWRGQRSSEARSFELFADARQVSDDDDR